MHFLSIAWPLAENSSLMDTPSYTPPPIDPLTVQAEQQAQNQLVAGLQSQARGDMGSLMAAYGKLAMGIGSAPSVYAKG